MNINLTRDDVAAGDDPTAYRFIVPDDTTLTEILRLALVQRYLPVVAGGRATWVVYFRQQPVAVLAQQWQEPLMLTSLPLPTDVSLYFRYHQQSDPEEVLASLRGGDS